MVEVVLMLEHDYLEIMTVPKVISSVLLQSCDFWLLIDIYLLQKLCHLFT